MKKELNIHQKAALKNAWDKALKEVMQPKKMPSKPKQSSKPQSIADQAIAVILADMNKGKQYSVYNRIKLYEDAAKFMESAGASPSDLQEAKVYKAAVAMIKHMASKVFDNHIIFQRHANYILKSKAKFRQYMQGWESYIS